MELALARLRAMFTAQTGHVGTAGQALGLACHAWEKGMTQQHPDYDWRLSVWCAWAPYEVLENQGLQLFTVPPPPPPPKDAQYEHNTQQPVHIHRHKQNTLHHTNTNKQRAPPNN